MSRSMPINTTMQPLLRYRRAGISIILCLLLYRSVTNEVRKYMRHGIDPSSTCRVYDRVKILAAVCDPPTDQREA